MSEALGVGFPVLSIKRINLHVEVLPVIQASPGNSDAVGVRPGNVVALYSADRAEQMLSGACIESILREGICALNKLEVASRNYNVDIP